jgi:hypothetical protein
MAGTGTQVTWGDYDNDGDGDLDLAVAGRTTGFMDISTIYRNDAVVANTAPVAPTGLDVTVSEGLVLLAWSPSTDAQTDSAALSYNIRVGTTSGGGDVLAGMADAATGLRRIPACGIAQPGASVCEWSLHLPIGTYFWSVQAIDTAFSGSPWSAEDTFVVPETIEPPPPCGGERRGRMLTGTARGPGDDRPATGAGRRLRAAASCSL